MDDNNNSPFMDDNNNIPFGQPSNNISQELKDFIIKITTTCEKCGLPIYIKDPYRKICHNLCDMRKQCGIKIANRPFDKHMDMSHLYNFTDSSLISRIDLTKLLINYLNIHCKTKKDKTRPINFPGWPERNEDIKKLFKLKDTDELTFSNLQQYIKQHIN
jgi:hypothetical protein